MFIGKTRERVLGLNQVLKDHANIFQTFENLYLNLKKKKHCASVCVILIFLPCMMLLLWLVVEGFWDRPRLVGFGSAAAAPKQTKEQFGAVSLCIYMEVFHFTVLNESHTYSSTAYNYSVLEEAIMKKSCTAAETKNPQCSTTQFLSPSAGHLKKCNGC